MSFSALSIVVHRAAEGIRWSVSVAVSEGVRTDKGLAHTPQAALKEAQVAAEHLLEQETTRPGSCSCCALPLRECKRYQDKKETSQ